MLQLSSRTLIFGFLFVLMLFAGCIGIETRHMQKADGSADVTYTMDMKGLAEYIKQAGSQYGSSDSYDLDKMNICENVTKNAKDVDCKYSNNVVTLSKHFSKDAAFYKFEAKDNLFTKKYVLTIEELPNFASSLDSGDSSLSAVTKKQKLTDPESASSAKMLSTYGITMKYVVSMPGEIKTADGADKMNATAATFDVLKMMGENKKIVVESEETNMVMVLAVGAVGLLAVLGVAVFAMGAMKPPSPPQKTA